VKRRHNLLGSILLVVLSTAQADVIYDSGLPNNSQWRNSDYSNQFGGQAADDFLLDTGAILTGITWYGSYLFTPTQPMPDAFTIRVYTDDLGMPSESPLYTALFSGGVDRQFTGVVASGGYEMYHYDVAVAPLALSANTRYWLSIVNSTSSSTQFMGWAWAYNQDGEDPQFVGDATHRWVREGGEWTTYGSSNLAFSLLGQSISVPEPSALALFSLGLLGLGFARRRA